MEKIENVISIPSREGKNYNVIETLKYKHWCLGNTHK